MTIPLLIRRACFIASLMFLVLLVSGALRCQVATVELVDGTVLTAKPGQIVDVGLARLQLHRLEPAAGAVYQAQIENRGRHVLSIEEELDKNGKKTGRYRSNAEWIAVRRWTLNMPAGWMPTYHPFDGTRPVPPASDDATVDRTWVVLDDQNRRAIHYRGDERWFPGNPTKFPASGHALEGRQVLQIVFGEPGIDVALDREGQSKLGAYLGGGLSGGGHPHVQRVIDQWDAGPEALDARLSPWTAGSWVMSAHDLMPWSGWRPMRGVQWLGATPSPDGVNGGSNGRYNFGLWLLARGTPGALLLGRTMIRHKAACGFVHEGLDEGPRNSQAWATANARYEKADGDVPGDATIAQPTHNFVVDLQAGAALFPGDRLLARTADEVRRKLLAVTAVWGGTPADSRSIDRALDGLRAAAIFTGEDRYYAQASAVLDDALTKRRIAVTKFAAAGRCPTGVPCFPNDGQGDGKVHTYSWFDCGNAWRVAELDMDGRASPAQVEWALELARWTAANCVRADGACPYDAHWAADGTLHQTYMDWAPSIAPWFGPLLWWASRKDPSLKPACAKVVRYWLTNRYGPKTEWCDISNAANEKTRGQEALMSLRGGQIIRDALSW